MAGVNGWSMVDVEMRFPSLPPSIRGGVVVIRSRDVYAVKIRITKPIETRE
jgi:hypothetical protein